MMPVQFSAQLKPLPAQTISPRVSPRFGQPQKYSPEEKEAQNIRTMIRNTLIRVGVLLALGAGALGVARMMNPPQPTPPNPNVPQSTTSQHETPQQ